MKYRIRCDLIFDVPADATTILNWLKSQNVIRKVINIAEEKSFLELEECHHDEGGTCRILQRIEK